MQEVYVNCHDLEWQDMPSYPPGTKGKILRDDKGGKTVLLKIPAGFEMPAHSHTTGEQHYVLEGQYRIEDQIYEEGTYHFMPPGDTHGPFKSENGATLLVIWDKFSDQ